MSGESLPVLTVSVRDLVDFVWRTGGLGGSDNFSPPGRALAGTRGHQRLQRQRPEGYEAEVPIQWDIPSDGFILRLRGRIDGIWPGEPVCVEEIKTVYGFQQKEPDPLHIAQAKIYAFIHAKKSHLDPVAILLSYLDLETELVTEFRELLSFEQLNEFFERTTTEYVEWMQDWFEWQIVRNASLTALPFPFSSYRAGQRRMAVAVYRGILAKERLFVEAPTGIGKTLSALYPALKALAGGAVERIFYLTAKTVGRVVAQKALADMRATGARVRSLTLTARDKICFGEDGRCDRSECPFAIAYYDRRKPALQELLARETLDRSAIEAVARKHEVCPFELSLDAALWCDVIIGDYNYAFDPTAYLKRFFEEPGAHVFLVDEAHNLVDRAREMFSADLNPEEVTTTRKLIKISIPKLDRALGKLLKALRELPDQPDTVAAGREAIAWETMPDDFAVILETSIKHASAWLARNEPASFREALLMLVFSMMRFQRVATDFDARYRAIYHQTTGSLQLFCLDPSTLLGQALDRGLSAVFFSATLSPEAYYREVLGGSGVSLKLPGPFPSDNLSVLIGTGVETTFKKREESQPLLVDSIAPLLMHGDGNTLVFFPSFKYLDQTRTSILAAHPDLQILAQKPGMTEEERAEFLAAFHGSEPVIGFAVLGGLFGEGIDLVGERLRQAVVVGVGLPQLSLERDLIRTYFQEKTGAGFEYAYLFPGMNRVLQAVGRVIRTESDRGLVLLLDKRFQEQRHERLFPAWWQTIRVLNAQSIRSHAKAFWSGGNLP